MMNRRSFVWSTATLMASVPLKGFASAPEGAVPLTIHEDLPGAKVPADFVGLSYETQQLNDPSFFSVENKALLPFFRTLSKNGVLRLGGNTSANSWWKPTEASVKPEFKNYRHVVEDGVPSDKLAYSITPKAVVNLKAFLDATGWRAIYGLNLANGTPEAAAEEAAFVAKTLGSKLLYFQVGNEVDLFERSVRPMGWTPDQYYAEWIAFARAIVARVPGAMFSAPDVAVKSAWITRFAELLAAEKDAPKVAAVTHHYYAGGPPSDPKLTRERLLSTDARVAREGAAALAAAKVVGSHVRLTEGNTCYHGGKPGVSDVFAATLWASGYSLTLASMGYSGVNLHGGGGKQVADSLGGKLPGEALLPPGSGWHPSPFYTPIATAPDTGFLAEPVYYGLLMADYFAGCTMVPVELPGVPENVRVFAARGDSESARLGKKMRVLILNPSGQEVRVKLNTRARVEVERLTSSALDGKTVHFGGGEVTAAGVLNGARAEKVSAGEVVVARESGALISWAQK